MATIDTGLANMLILPLIPYSWLIDTVRKILHVAHIRMLNARGMMRCPQGLRKVCAWICWKATK